jgi:hypothetical protein
VQAKHDTTARLRSIKYEYCAWEARIVQPAEDTFSGGSWASTGPDREPEYGITIRVSDPKRLREIAAALIEAAEQVE